ncbi:AbrB/MazE/SpoVT family DNA-binding domain-containing protein [Luteolibacter sp. Populi]|uniref:AbrB/MazE/SpoVT family DNA-binding domain-containing protein n=1 Tax=Luteolibacter sp. Populi TaxID=3230487 RepID=UPI003465B67C
MIATVSSEGQITIPLAIRERLGLKAGDRIDFDEEPTVLLGRRVIDRAKWDEAVAELQKMAAENLKGHPWEHMSSAEMIDDMRGGPCEVPTRGDFPPD